jgi:membrane protease subunit HflK
MSDMAEASGSQQRQAQHFALLGLLLQLASFGTLAGIAYWSESAPIAAGARFAVVGIPIWVVLFLVFKQVRRVRAEQLESAELRRAREAGTDSALFDMERDEMLIEQNRLRWMIRWVLPSATVLLASVLLGGQFLFWGWSLDTAFQKATEGGVHRTDEPTMMMWFVVGVLLANFLYASYCLGLARLPDWRLLRAGAACMAGNALVCLALLVALMATRSVEWAEPAVAYLIRVGMIVLGLEFAANFVLDLYRPRQPDFVPRPSFDSRLLGVISEPGSVARSIAEAINYQFGFEVTSNWFYQLLQRWLFPITVFTIVVIIALSGIVIVDADEQAVVERFGRVREDGGEVLRAGFHVKWPFPIDIARRAPVGRIRELVIGEATAEEDEHEDHAVLWTEKHDYIPELMLLVAAPKEAKSAAEKNWASRLDAESEGGRSVPVSLLMVSVPIEYRIKDIHKYLYHYSDPLAVMEAVAYQFISDYAASVDSDALMGPGRERLNAELERLLQQRLDDLDTGIEIAFVGIRGAHPPSQEQVAESFQAAVSAETRMQATINAAEGEARRILIAAAGTEARAKELDEAIQARDVLGAKPDANPQKLADAEQRVQDLLLGNAEKEIAAPSGRIAADMATARADATKLANEWASKAQAFGTELAAYQAAPALYKQRKILQIYSDLDDVRKYLIIGDPSNVKVIYDTKEPGGLDRVLSEGVEQERKKSP